MALKRREKILLTFVLIAAAIWAFDWAYYAPKRMSLLSLREEIKALDLKLNQFLLFTDGVKAAEAEIARLEKELKGLQERTLKGEELRAFLRHLAKRSDPQEMKVVSLTSQEEKLFLPGGEKGMSPSPYVRVTIQMVLHSSYPKVWAYLREIKDLPFLVHVDHLEIERTEEVLPLLRVTMGLSMYALSL